MNAAPWWARRWIWRLDLIWRVPLLPCLLAAVLVLVVFWKTLEWHYG